MRCIHTFATDDGEGDQNGKKWPTVIIVGTHKDVSLTGFACSKYFLEVCNTGQIATTIKLLRIDNTGALRISCFPEVINGPKIVF